jgi:hypothetical protein
MNLPEEPDTAHASVRVNRHTHMTDRANLLKRIVKVMLLIHLESRLGQ